MPSTITGKRSIISADLSTVRLLALEDTIAVLIPLEKLYNQQNPENFENLYTVHLDPKINEFIFPVAKAAY